METLAIAASLSTAFPSSSNSSLLDPTLIKLFGSEYHSFLSMLKLLEGDSYQNQRAALEIVRPSLDEVYNQISKGASANLTNGNLVWYIQKMVELRTAALHWAKSKGLV